VLDPAASDDASRLVEAALPKTVKHASWDRAADTSTDNQSGQPGQPGRSGGGHRGGRGGGSDAGRSGSSGAAHQPSAMSGGRSPAEFVRAFALPAPRLEIAEEPTLVVITQGERRRAFQPGDEEPVSVTDRFGSRSVQAGWVGADFVIDSRDGSRLKIVERYRQLPNDRLASTLDFNAQGIKTLRIRTVYRRATAAELAAPPLEGPPAPGPR
jgi:hypothetical protein